MVSIIPKTGVKVLTDTWNNNGEFNRVFTEHPDATGWHVTEDKHLHVLKNTQTIATYADGHWLEIHKR